MNPTIEMHKKIDSEILLSLCEQAEILKVENYINKPFEDIDDLISDLSRTIIRDRFQGTDTVVRIHRNRGGFSASIKSEKIERVLSFIHERYHIDPRDEEFDRVRFQNFIMSLSRPDFEFFYNGDSYQQKENRVVFYFTFNDYRYSQGHYLVFYALFEMLHFLEDVELAFDELSSYQEEYNAHRERMHDIRERERLEELERIRAEEERVRREAEERASALRQSQIDYERRQQLLRQGATEEGIEIGERLLQFLQNR